MDICSTYSARITGESHIFTQTVSIYRAAVSFFISIALEKWDELSILVPSTLRVNKMESYTVATKRRPEVPFPFEKADTRFYKMPCYLRRAAISQALGKVSSYKGNLANWEKADEKNQGKRTRDSHRR